MVSIGSWRTRPKGTVPFSRPGCFGGNRRSNWPRKPGQSPARGFTLIELLVVLVIIGMLVGLLIPAVLAARERARITQCADNQKNLGQALIQYDLDQGSFPGFANRVPGLYTAEAAWPVMILKLIGREDVWNAFREYNPTTRVVPNARIGLFLCPSDSDASGDGPALSFVANCGQPDAGDTVPVNGENEYLGYYSTNIPPDWPANGVFFRQYSASTSPLNPPFVKVKLTADDIKDGTQHTFLISERPGTDVWNCSCPEEEKGMGFVWSQEEIYEQGGTAPIDVTSSFGINGDSAPRIGSGTGPELWIPASYHPNGVNVAYCDGRVKFLDDQVSYQVYALQMTPDGSMVKAPGSTTLGATNAWWRQPLGE